MRSEGGGVSAPLTTHVRRLPLFAVIIVLCSTHATGQQLNRAVAVLRGAAGQSESIHCIVTFLQVALPPSKKAQTSTRWLFAPAARGPSFPCPQ